ncbi:hypothetical protein KFK09_018164 [Dendrobium nobile]|uniref:Uncharacterized protein n=1 Tax=Dendrobium nobile TaxID=94219 RepID=A0A8T3ATM8_DENNO|nr:hypothetical protein KFK09_018164 [Dendrobium nobile]
MEELGELHVLASRWKILKNRMSLDLVGISSEHKLENNNTKNCGVIKLLKSFVGYDLSLWCEVYL